MDSVQPGSMIGYSPTKIAQLEMEMGFVKPTRETEGRSRIRRLSTAAYLNLEAR